MYRTFNMGIGMILIAAPETAEGIRSRLAQEGEPEVEIGRVVRGDHDVTIKGGVFHG